MSESNQQYLTMALAYIEVGEIVSNSDSDQKNTSDFQNAIAYQLFHAIELFYKFMLGRRGVIKKTHTLAVLDEEYRRLYPEEKFRINYPFYFSEYECSDLNENEKELVKKHLEKFNPKFMDQHLRYPADNNTGGYSFIIDASTFQSVRAQMLLLVNY